MGSTIDINFFLKIDFLCEKSKCSIRKPVEAMYGYVGLFMDMYGYVCLCRAMYGYVWPCRAM